MARNREGFTQLSVYLPSAVHQAFKRMSVDQQFSMSDWIAEKVEQAVIEAGYYTEKTIDQYQSLAELVEDKRSILEEQTKIPTAMLDAMQEGDEPDELNLLRLGLCLNIEQVDLMALCDRSFPKRKRRDNGQPNGI